VAVAARIAVLVPLAALVFAITVLAIKAYPAIKYNGFRVPHEAHVERRWLLGLCPARLHERGGAPRQRLVRRLGTHRRHRADLLHRRAAGAAYLDRGRLCPHRAPPPLIARPLGFAVELLAGIPSVIFGLWGILTLGPFLAKHVYPIVADHMPDVPVLRYFRQPVGSGEGSSRQASCSPS